MKPLNLAIFAAYVATIPAANWLIGNVGDCSHGPCLIPVGFGLYAPSGVLMIGLALALRDMVHERSGKVAAIAAIIIGTAVSALVAPPALVLASAVAFLASELLDLAVYTPLRRRNIPLAVAASGLVGSVIDSAAFLLIAFGSLDYIAGQVVGKVEITMLAAAVVAAWQSGKLAIAQEGGE